MSEQSEKNVAAIKMVNITKTFGGVRALDRVSFEVGEGEVRGLIGENGAGKSTLMKILSGVHTDYSGDMYIRGKQVRFGGTSDSLGCGIGMIYQELSVIECLTVAENNFLGIQPVNRAGVIKWRYMQKLAREHLKSLGIDVDVNLPLSFLSFSIRQMIEIAKVIFSGAQIIIMDEPTSSLSHAETGQLFKLVRTLKKRGHTIIFISHFIEDVMTISDSITILKDGKGVATLRNVQLSKHEVINSMIGVTKGHLVREADEIVELKSPDSDVIMEVKDLTKTGSFEDVTFDLKKGEILGLYGPLGAGQENVGKAIFGLKGYDSGMILLEGKLLRKERPYKKKNLGVAYISEDRKRSLFHKFELFKNITLPFLADVLGPKMNWIIKPKKEKDITNRQIEKYSIKTSGPEAVLNSLSGGNQQKVAIAKWLTIIPKVIIFQEPTRGVDVGAKAEIVEAIKTLKNQGLSCIVISMEPETILDLSDRVMIFSRGRVVSELKDTKTSKLKILEIA
ncbi:MAG: sugar ABC transporter ATP-binding protein [Spirochaetes bacterium]|nr:sugar ABC transporter ATP-binding protein [Spirochaetota bacterium]